MQKPKKIKKFTRVYPYMQYFVCKNLISRGLKRSSEKWEEGRKIGREQNINKQKELRPKKYITYLHTHTHTHIHTTLKPKNFFSEKFSLTKIFFPFSIPTSTTINNKN